MLKGKKKLMMELGRIAAKMKEMQNAMGANNSTYKPQEEPPRQIEQEGVVENDMSKEKLYSGG